MVLYYRQLWSQSFQIQTRREQINCEKTWEKSVCKFHVFWEESKASGEHWKTKKNCRGEAWNFKNHLKVVLNLKIKFRNLLLNIPCHMCQSPSSFLILSKTSQKKPSRPKVPPITCKNACNYFLLSQLENNVHGFPLYIAIIPSAIKKWYPIEHQNTCQTCGLSNP